MRKATEILCQFKNLATAGITRKLFIYFVCCGLFFIIFIALFLAYNEYNNAKGTIRDTFEFIRQGYLQPITSSLFKMDEHQLESELQGVLKLYPIVYVHIRDELGSGFVMSLGVHDAGFSSVKEFPLLYDVGGKMTRVGTFYVTYGMGLVYKKLLKQTLWILLVSIVLGSVVLMVFLYFFNKIVVRHLLVIADFALKQNLSEIGPKLKLVRPAHKSDELDLLVESFNNMLSRIENDISERKQMEEMLSEREEKFRTIFEKAGNGILLADAITKRFIEGNATICTMLGYSKEEIMNLTVYDIHPPHGIPHVIDEFEKQFKKEKLISEDVPVLRKDGSIFYADVDSVPITIRRMQYLVGIFRDTTLQKQSEALLKQSEERFRDLYENAPNAYFSVGVDGIIRRCNLQAEKLLGYNKEEIIGRHVFEIYADTPNGKEKAKKVFERLRKGVDSINEDLQLKDVRGNILWARFTINIVKDEHGKIIESRATVLDITEKKRLEQQLQTMSFTDELSGLHNRRGFITLSEQQIKVAERTKKDMLLFFADLDKMKQINDTLGHQEGDKALIDISNILKEAFRESDIIGRIGGDEFAVLALNTTNDTKDFLIKRLHNTIDNYNRPEGRNYQLSLSIGIAHYDPEKPSSFDELIAQADELMYEEKRKKKG